MITKSNVSSGRPGATDRDISNVADPDQTRPDAVFKHISYDENVVNFS